MNIKQTPLTTAANLAFFMVNLSQVLRQRWRPLQPYFSVLDLKAHFGGLKYVAETLKLLPNYLTLLLFSKSPPRSPYWALSTPHNGEGIDEHHTLSRNDVVRVRLLNVWYDLLRVPSVSHGTMFSCMTGTRYWFLVTRYSSHPVSTPPSVPPRNQRQHAAEDERRRGTETRPGAHPLPEDAWR